MRATSVVDRSLLELVSADLGLDVTMARDQFKPAAVSPKTFGRCTDEATQGRGRGFC